MALSRIVSNFFLRVRQVIQGDLTYKKLQKEVLDRETKRCWLVGETKRYWLEDDLLNFKGGRLFVSRSRGLRRELMKETHDSKWVGHSRQAGVLALLNRSYFWLKMEEDVETYGRSCLVC